MDKNSLTAYQKWMVLTVGTAFGLGLLPLAPGSFAALFGVGLHLLFFFFFPKFLFIPLLVFSLLLVSYLNHILTPWAEAYWQKEDPGNFVLDEIAGYLMVPIFFHSGSESVWLIAAVGFLLFRILDIIKIEPARYFDRHVHNAWGILIDDLISGAYAVMLMYAAQYFGVFGWM